MLKEPRIVVKVPHKSESPNLATEAFWLGLPGDQAFRKETLAGWPLLPTPLSRRLKY